MLAVAHRSGLQQLQKSTVFTFSLSVKEPVLLVNIVIIPLIDSLPPSLPPPCLDPWSFAVFSFLCCGSWCCRGLSRFSQRFVEPLFGSVLSKPKPKPRLQSGLQRARSYCHGDLTGTPAWSPSLSVLHTELSLCPHYVYHYVVHPLYMI